MGHEEKQDLTPGVQRKNTEDAEKTENAEKGAPFGKRPLQGG
jgi:hypothetical protein